MFTDKNLEIGTRTEETFKPPVLPKPEGARNPGGGQAIIPGE